MKTSEFQVAVNGSPLTCLLAEPAKLAADPALLITVALTRQSAISEDVYDLPTKAFLEAGHRIVSFDMPNHGDRVRPGQTSELHGLWQSLLAGDDPFARFIADGRAVIDAAIARGLATPGRIVVVGLSRAGYAALRLAAAEPRILATAALAPVTDWRVLTEFAEVKDRPEIAVLALENYANQLAGKSIYMSIGSADRRVGTEFCAGFITRILDAEAAIGVRVSQLSLHFIHNSENHRLPDEWRTAGARYLLEKLGR